MKSLSDNAAPRTLPPRADVCQSGPQDSVPMAGKKPGAPALVNRAPLHGSVQNPHALLEADSRDALRCMTADRLSTSTPRLAAVARTPASVSETAVPATRVVELANHVSMQIFRPEPTRDNGRVILFLHGGPNSIEYDDSFAPMTAWFLDHGYTLIAPEIAGSKKPGLQDAANSYTENYVRDLVDVVGFCRNDPDLKEKSFTAVGHSYGAYQLASFLTSQCSSAEAKSLFTSVVFMAANLDTAETRLFANPLVGDRFFPLTGALSEVEENRRFAAMANDMTRDFRDRHAALRCGAEAGQMLNFLSTPLMDQALNERFSPAYRLEKIPAIPILFIHALDDTQVPPSQSLDAAEKINRSGGAARLVVTAAGGHAFFKQGKTHNGAVLDHCFSALDTHVRDAAAIPAATLDGQAVALEALPAALSRVDAGYRNYGGLLKDFHAGTGEMRPGSETYAIPSRHSCLLKMRRVLSDSMENLKKMPPAAATSPAMLRMKAEKEALIVMADRLLADQAAGQTDSEPLPDS